MGEEVGNELFYSADRKALWEVRNPRPFCSFIFAYVAVYLMKKTVNSFYSPIGRSFPYRL